jgi:DNA-binding transcriptional MerR regulator
MDIAEVAKASGLPASTLRFYEEKGLIQSNGRSGLRRLFSANVLERLALISLGRSAGFSLDEIDRMFTPKGPNIDRKLLSAKAEELDRKIKELTSMRDGSVTQPPAKRPATLNVRRFFAFFALPARIVSGNQTNLQKIGLSDEIEETEWDGGKIPGNEQASGRARGLRSPT